MTIYFRQMIAGMVALCLLLVGCTGEEREMASHAAANRTACPAPLEGDVSTLASALKEHVRSFKRDHSFYHWGKRGRGSDMQTERLGIDEIMNLPARSKLDPNREFSGSVPLQPRDAATGRHAGQRDLAAEYFKAISANFFKIGKEEQSWFVGNGLYVATDPAVSNEFGESSEFGEEEPAFLLQIDVPAGLKYLDLRQGVDHPIFPFKGRAAEVASAAYLRGLACRPPNVSPPEVSPEPGNLPTVDNFLDSPYTRDLIKKVFVRLGVSIVASNWGGVAYSKCTEIADETGVDFIFTDPGVVDQLGFKVFAKELEDNPTREKAVEYERVRRLLYAADIDTRHFKEELRSAFTQDWRALFAKRTFDFKDLPDVDPTKLFGCSADPQFIEETRFRDPKP